MIALAYLSNDLQQHLKQEKDFAVIAMQLNEIPQLNGWPEWVS